jgi:hypothetical protein
MCYLFFISVLGKLGCLKLTKKIVRTFVISLNNMQWSHDFIHKNTQLKYTQFNENNSV